jgi:hypothetical protein
MPGIGLEIEGAMQQAPQPGRQANDEEEGRAAADCMARLSAQVACAGQPA